jgi:hypothetical protein
MQQMQQKHRAPNCAIRDIMGKANGNGKQQSDRCSQASCTWLCHQSPTYWPVQTRLNPQCVPVHTYKLWKQKTGLNVGAFAHTTLNDSTTPSIQASPERCQQHVAPKEKAQSVQWSPGKYHLHRRTLGSELPGSSRNLAYTLNASIKACLMYNNIPTKAQVGCIDQHFVPRNAGPPACFLNLCARAIK